MLDLKDNDKKVFFCGIGGISMSGFAEMLKDKGFEVLGSDRNESSITKHLESIGIKVLIGQKAENITNDIDLFVNTAAIKADNPEMIKAHELGLKVIERSELLGDIMKNFKYSIGISGTHGKTTTTSMICHIFIAAKKDPTISLGGMLDLIGGNMRCGNGEYFIAEACEYCDSFLQFYPTTAVILNIEADHLDYFKDINAIRTSFIKYAKHVPKAGNLIINADIDNLEEITSQMECNVITYSVDNKKADWTADNISYDENGKGRFDIIHRGEKVGRVSLNVGGIHNISNSLAAIAAAYSNGLKMEIIIKGLESFSGTHRRFEYKGELKGVRIIDDYAHHPTEIKATLNLAKANKHNKLWCIFQPHTYTRTKELLQEFSQCFDEADNIIIADIYAAREKNTVKIYPQDLVEKIKKRGKNAMYLGGFEQIEKYIIENAVDGDLLITMGAGDVYLIGEALLNN